MWKSGRPAQRPRQPSHVDDLHRAEPSGRSRPSGQPTLDVPDEREHGERVVRETAVPLALVGAETRGGEDRRSAERAGREHRLGRGERAVAPGSRCRRCRARSSTERRRSCSARPDEGRGGRDAGDVALDAGADRDGRPQVARARGARARCPRARPAARRRGAGRRRPAGPRRARRRPARPGCGASSRRREGPPSRLGARCAVLLGVPNGVLERRVRELHHVGAGLPARSSPRVRFAWRTS